MNSETYVAAQGLIARQLQLDNIAHNIANANTTGFREVSPFFRSFNRALAEGPANPMNNASNNQPVIAGVYMHSMQGAIKPTGNALDIAIEGDGFFKLNTPFGTRYTRNGNLTINEQGFLQTHSGFNVLDSNDQPITLNSDVTSLHVNREGAIVQDGNAVAQIKLVSFADKTQLLAEEDSLIVNQNPTGGEQAGTGRFVGQALETSNVNIAKQMIDMITAQRAYDFNTRTIRTIDTTMDEGVIRGFGPR